MAQEVRVRREDTLGLDPVSVENPFPVSVENQPGPGYQLVTVAIQRTPGQVAADALDAGDALGTTFTIPNVTTVPGQGWELVTAHLLDRSDQAIATELALFKEPIAGTANDAAFAPTDDELNNYAGTVSWTTFFNNNANTVSTVANPGIQGNTGTTPHLYGQLVTRGTPTVTAGGEYGVILVFKRILG